MKRRSSPTIRAQVIRGSFYLLLLVAATLLAFFPLKAPAKSERRSLTFAQRVGYQRAMEEVYWQHRIWPQANAVPKPSLEKVMSQTQIEKKVEDYLRNSQALEDYWQRPITPDQLQAEMERIANHTKQPGVLRELFAALGNDPLVIAECLTRPVLAERLLTELYAHDDRFHGELKRRAAAELRTHRSVKQMKQTSDTYTEMGWIKSDSAKEDFAPADAKSAEAVKMNSSEWQESVAKLAEQFGGSRGREAAAFGTRRHVAAFESADMAAHSKNAADDEYKTLPVGKLSLLREDEGHYYALAVTKKGKDRLKLATVAWLKEPLRSWLARAEAQMPATMATVSADYALPAISGQSDSWSPSVNCTNNTWTATSTAGAPAAREYHTAVWTGSEMIVWGGGVGPTSFNTGGRYNPSTDSWTATNTTNAPHARRQQTAVWTGTEMIVWGGDFAFPPLNTGGRYNPSTDTWRATSTTNAPDGRYWHTAIWDGNVMIIWGGNNGSYLHTGGRYNPVTNSWTATSTFNTPAARGYHTAVWVGSQMIVWGGTDNGNYWNTGGRYNPSTNSWTATSTTGAPARRDSHTTVWTGSEMIIWGGENNGSNFNTGGRYNPGTDSWTATSTTNAPTPRVFHTAVWTGSQMIVWGGRTTGGLVNTGGRYSAQAPPTPTPTPTPTHTPTPTATATPIPVVITRPATNVASFSATLDGSLNPRGSTTIVYFQYGLTTSYGHTTPMQTQNGNTVRAITANISGLSASHTYHFRIVAHNGGGTVSGSDGTFTTLTAAGPPIVITNRATNIGSFSATLHGSLDPHGLATTVYFEYGTTTSYGSTTANQTKTGNTYQNVAASISGLAAITAYHFRIVATNSAGTAYGSDRSFATFRKDESVAFQNNVVHDGSDPASPLVTPLTVKWRRNFSASGVSLISYPLIAEGRVFVTTTTSGPSGIETLMALDARTGSTLWSANVNGGFGFANAAYDSGRVFVVNYDGLAKAFDAATGTLLWSLLLPYPTLGCDAPPIAVNGRVYISGFGYGGDLYAVDETNGAVRWTMPVNTGDGSSPAVTSGRVFVYYACPESYAFNAATGQQVWYSYLCCG